MPSYCSAYGCRNSGYIKGISFHSFPLNNKVVLENWLWQIKRENFAPTKHSKLCCEHFEDDCFIIQNFTGKRLLKQDAVPTKFCFSKTQDRREKNSYQMSLPKDEKRKRLWEEQMKQFNIITKPTKRVCSKHFDKECFDRNKFGGSWLKSNAVPTIFSLTENVHKQTEQSTENQCLATSSKPAGVNGLKRRKLKRTAIPSCNLPTSPDYDYTDECENSITLEKTKKLKSNTETPISDRLTEYTSKRIYCPDETDSHESFGNKEEMNETSLSSIVHIKEECVDTSPNYSDTDAVEHTSENLKKFTRTSTIPHFTIKYRENCDFDHSLFKSSPDDSKEIVTQKLEAMLSAYATLEKKVEFYQNKCKIYEKEVNILKGVIDNLKLINSVAFDN